MSRVNLIGLRFGKLEVIAFVEMRGNYRSYWKCQCDCGERTVVRCDSLRSGQSRSCGCLQKAQVAERSFKHGAARNGQEAPEYKVWAGMISRCTNPNAHAFMEYGGRGIAVCDRWLHSFEAFLADMGQRPPRTTLDRIDNDRGYEPGNCRWATPEEQQSNRRNNRVLTLNGVTRSLAEWSRVTGIGEMALWCRLKRGWNEEMVLTTPLHKRMLVRCCLCERLCRKTTAHLHQRKWIGEECCWDERLRSSE
jgi:hypothetical protein